MRRMYPDILLVALDRVTVDFGVDLDNELYCRKQDISLAVDHVLQFRNLNSESQTLMSSA